ncbi:unnamed protein product [Rotaria socialis]|uniref:Uncharacterized protein n=1 Tax=Rotaria socialis TaxID=392032 RepID=A0A817QG09_9BILA|nr:unnamed protein product [Rotaria socialis]CAF3323408.1 unnamed protein product [Rotaria socialis]
MHPAQSNVDLLTTNLAYQFHNNQFIKNKQTCSHKLSSDKYLIAKKVRINMNKYGYLFDSFFSQQSNNNQKLNKEIPSSNKKQKKIKNTNKTKNRKVKLKQAMKPKSEKLITTSPSTNKVQIGSPSDRMSSHIPRIDYHQSSMLSPVSSSISSVLSDVQNREHDNHKIDSTSYKSDQCREKMKILYERGPIVNENYINARNLSNQFDLIKTRQLKKMKEYSKGFKPEQLFRCPKDTRSKRRKCCGGIYYELFNDAWRLLEEWFMIR